MIQCWSNASLHYTHLYSTISEIQWYIGGESWSEWVFLAFLPHFAFLWVRPGTIAMNVTRLERGFNACKTSRCISIFNHFWYSKLLVENCDIFIPHLCLAPPQGVTCRNFVKMFDAGKTRVIIGLPYGEKNYDDVKPFSYNTSVSRTDGRTDGRPDGRTDRIAISISRVSALTRDINAHLHHEDCWKSITRHRYVAIYQKWLQMHGYMQRGVLQALNPLSIPNASSLSRKPHRRVPSVSFLVLHHLPLCTLCRPGHRRVPSVCKDPWYSTRVHRRKLTTYQLLLTR